MEEGWLNFFFCFDDELCCYKFFDFIGDLVLCVVLGYFGFFIVYIVVFKVSYVFYVKFGVVFF